MPFIKKEIFFLLPLILIGSLIIYFINPSQLNNNQKDTKEQNISVEYYQNNKNEISGLFKEIQNMKLNDKINFIPDVFSNENQEPTEIIQEEQNVEQQEISQNNQSIFDKILTRTEKIPSEFENTETCTTCDQSQGSTTLCDAEKLNDPEAISCQNNCSESDRYKEENILAYVWCIYCPCYCLCVCAGYCCC